MRCDERVDREPEFSLQGRGPMLRVVAAASSRQPRQGVASALQCDGATAVGECPQSGQSHPLRLPAGAHREPDRRSLRPTLLAPFGAAALGQPAMVELFAKEAALLHDARLGRRQLGHMGRELLRGDPTAFLEGVLDRAV